MNQLREDDNRRMEELLKDNCEFDENNWLHMMKIILNIKRVTWRDMKMEEEEWERLVDVIQQRWGQGAIKLKRLYLWDCNIGEQPTG